MEVASATAEAVSGKINACAKPARPKPRPKRIRFRLRPVIRIPRLDSSNPMIISLISPRRSRRSFDLRRSNLARKAEK